MARGDGLTSHICKAYKTNGHMAALAVADVLVDNNIPYDQIQVVFELAKMIVDEETRPVWI